MASTATNLDFERRARLSVVWQDLVTPVRAIVGYQEIIVEDGLRLGLTDLMPYLDKVLVAAGSLSELVDWLRDPGSHFEADRDDDLGGVQAKLRHDLRTPLNAIIGYSEMVLEDLEAAPQAEGLRPDLVKLLGEARRLLDRIDAIVDLTRASGDRRATADAGEDDGAAEAVVAALLRTLRPDRDAVKTREVGRILVVDDNESNRDLLCRRLRHEGHEVVTAESGRRALETLEQARFDLILLDLMMPEMNGIEVLERLKSDERWHRTPVIMISGLSETDAVIRCIEAGAEDYLPKPFNLVLLRARINACLERKRWQEREREYLARLTAEKERSDALLLNILPAPVVLRLNGGETVIADRFESVSILFADIVGFTPAAALMAPAQLVDRLDRVFCEFDALARSLGVEKIKTIGDAYMAAAGIPDPRPDHAEAIAEFAVGILAALPRLCRPGNAPLQVRIGIHCGPVVAGVIGRHKFIYDVWGDTVNVASRLESHGVPDRIQVSEAMRDALAQRYEFEPRGAITLKGRGKAPAFLLVAPG
ncbi:MAG: response regulator [Rhizobiales bacterium]|nr:response regulator [Hyphomicrobiales bacterium]